MDKIIWVKFGWSDYYQGQLVLGDFGYLAGGDQGHEAWNFRSDSDRKYGCYVPPSGRSGSVPTSEEPSGWTVVFLSKKPTDKGIHVVGWYEDATLLGKNKNRSKNFDLGPHPTRDGKAIYSIESKNSFLVPPEFRTEPFSHPTVGSAKYSYLAGPGIKSTAEKNEVLDILQEKMGRLRSVVVKNPGDVFGPQDDVTESDPLAVFGTAEHRSAVEKAAIRATKSSLLKAGFSVESREPENIGYDLKATHKVSQQNLHVEVKGTSGTNERFFITANEYRYKVALEWRFALVTEALTNPRVTLYTLGEFEEAFDLVPMTWLGGRRRP